MKNQIIERVAIFIDGSNFYHGLKNNFRHTKIDFLKFAEVLCRGRKLMRIYYNVPIKKEDDEERYKSQQRFFAGLHSVPYLTLKLGRLEKRISMVEEEGRKEKVVSFVEKGVDINIAVDMLRLAHNDAYDTAILVTGDGDFAIAVEAVKDLGKHVENAYFKSGYSFHLRQACDKFILLDEKLLKKCLKIKNGRLSQSSSSRS